MRIERGPPVAPTTSTTSASATTAANDTNIESYEDAAAQMSFGEPAATMTSAAAAISKGSHSEEVRTLQQILNAYGAQPPLAVDGDFGPRTERALKLLQGELNVPTTGSLDPATTEAMGRRPAGGFEVVRSPHEARPGSVASQLADAARAAAERRNTMGRCAGGVGDALEAIGVKLRVASAYQYAEHFTKDERFEEVFVDRKGLKDLPPGAIVVWGKSANHPHGHVAITIGGGQEASDHAQSIRGGSYGGNWGGGVVTEQNFRVFIPKEKP
jgi:hypothetical protein